MHNSLRLLDERYITVKRMERFTLKVICVCVCALQTLSDPASRTTADPDTQDEVFGKSFVFFSVLFFFVSLYFFEMFLK